MSYFKTGQVLTVASGSLGVEVGYSGSAFEKPWGVLRGAGATGTIVLEHGGSIDVADLLEGDPFPCYPRSVSCTLGTIYVLG